MTDKVQKIREEVVEIINSINLFAPDEDGKNSSYEAGKLDVASSILQVIDSLQEEPTFKVGDRIRIKGTTVKGDVIKNIYQAEGGNTYFEFENSDDALANEMWELVEEFKPIRKKQPEGVLKELLDNMDEKELEKTRKEMLEEEPVSEEFEKNRLSHCDSITEEQYNLEQGFIDQHLDKNKRMPTFLDAIEYGMKLQKEQMMAKAIDATIEEPEPLLWRVLGELEGLFVAENNLHDGDGVKVIIIKEDNK